MVERNYDHRALIDKLGVMPGMRVLVDGVEDVDFAAALRGRDAERVEDGADMVFVGVEDRDGLSRVRAAWRRCRPAVGRGALWVIYPKGVPAIVTEHDVRAAGLALGIVDNKIARFSETHTAMRFVPRREPRR